MLIMRMSTSLISCAHVGYGVSINEVLNPYKIFKPTSIETYLSALGYGFLIAIDNHFNLIISFVLENDILLLSTMYIICLYAWLVPNVDEQHREGKNLQFAPPPSHVRRASEYASPSHHLCVTQVGQHCRCWES